VCRGGADLAKGALISYNGWDCELHHSPLHSRVSSGGQQRGSHERASPSVDDGQKVEATSKIVGLA
jgi:hypothetical protein